MAVVVVLVVAVVVVVVVVIVVVVLERLFLFSFRKLLQDVSEMFLED